MYIHAHYPVNLFFYKNKSKKLCAPNVIFRPVQSAKLHKLSLNILPPNLRRFEFIHLKLDLTFKFITDVINLTF